MDSRPRFCTVTSNRYDKNLLQEVADNSYEGNTGIWIVGRSLRGESGVPEDCFTNLHQESYPYTNKQGKVELDQGSICRVFSGTDVRLIYAPLEDLQSKLWALESRINLLERLSTEHDRLQG